MTLSQHSPTPRRALVVVNFSSHQLLRHNLRRVSAENPDVEVVVVDCWSGVQERAAVKELVAEEGWVGEFPSDNLGFGAGVNLGARAALDRGAEILTVLNPDAYIDSASLDALSAHVQDQPMSLAAPRTVRPDGTLWSAENDLFLEDGRMGATRKRPAGTSPEEVVRWVSGVCFAVHRDVWTTLEGFDEDYFMYWEDVDLCHRATEIGAEPVIVEAATVVHDEGGTQDGEDGAKSDLYYRYNVRGRALFARKHLSPAAQRRWRRHSARAAKQILLRGGRRHLVTRTGPARAALAGTVSGWRDPVSRTSTDPPLTVMLSFPPPRPTSNPYNVLLADSLRSVPGVTVKNFSWSEALRADYDVFHAHWPEILVDGASPAKKAVRQALFLALVNRLRAQSIPWVRTVHNLDLPDGITRRERALLELADRWTAMRITINTITELPAGQPHEVVLHGDYASWYGRLPQSASVPGRILFFGTVRRYKGVPALIQAFRNLTDPSLTLRVAGRVSHEEYAIELRDVSAGDPRITLSLDFLEDPTLVREVGEAELVVLPYPEMHNSGATLAALSLNRPVLVPDNEVNARLGEEVGPGWVQRFAGNLDAAAIEQALKSVRTAPPASPPDFSARDWADAGPRHVRAYRRALTLLRTPTASGDLT